MEKIKKMGLLGATALIGAGLAAMSEERIREFVKARVKEGAISKEEGKVLVEELVSETRKQRLNLEKNVVEKLHNTLQTADKELADYADSIDEIKIRELEGELEKMKSLRKGDK
ncbi:hypothetical protein [Methanohalophilus euhalobius]|jgi:polyhydroxyalkanoate synthesis regulator phasin|uniref:Polyhydroxyalkanoate synthesis regulator phasin n=1 Tax=Methanohalophilus euhalobius TaxID=51203 RepID=A0A315A230_9EURY|nr:hypothetical protein [Methanohalophilus euhalobius]PQV43521.1 polyhydroxyalkanoate synthesis regulator phasin [Methanohalophilus euhalobius]RNI07330.1 hypothetical protein EDD83_08985 [Methanohalophilus euhalobius]